MTAPGAPLVLVVDDDYDVRDALKDVLGEAGYAVDVATDGLDALTKLRAGLRPAVIVLDIMMPRMDGYAFRTEQLGSPTLAAIPVVVLSAATGTPEENRAKLGVGGGVYLPKPAHISDLLDAIARLTPS